MKKTTRNQNEQTKKPIKGFTEIKQVAESEPTPCEKLTETIPMGNSAPNEFEDSEDKK